MIAKKNPKKTGKWVLCFMKGAGSKNTHWLENTKCARISIYRLHMVVLSIPMQVCNCCTFFCFEFELIRVQPYWFSFYQGTAKTKKQKNKRMALSYMILLPFMLTLLLTSLIQSAKWKMAAFTAVFLWLSNIDSLTDHKSLGKLLWLFSFFLPYFCWCDLWCIVTSCPL